jgi:hypothetical protein
MTLGTSWARPTNRHRKASGLKQDSKRRRACRLKNERHRKRDKIDGSAQLTIVVCVYLYGHSRDDLELRVFWKKSTHPAEGAADETEHSCSNRQPKSSLGFRV